MKIAYTGGSFDVALHEGHINFLKNCKKIADKVVVSLNTDSFIERFKRKPILSYKERKAMLLGCKYVDEVVENFGEEDSKPAILLVKPDFVCIGSDWAKKDYMAQMKFNQEWLDENNITLVYFQYTEGISSSDIINRIKNL